MVRKPILLRNYSRESEEAEQILTASGVEYARCFDNESIKPCIVSNYGTYEGTEGVRRFVRVLQSTSKKAP